MKKWGEQTSGTLLKHILTVEVSAILGETALILERIKREIVDKRVKIVRTHQLNMSLSEKDKSREDPVGKDWEWGPLQASHLLYLHLQLSVVIC